MWPLPPEISKEKTAEEIRFIRFAPCDTRHEERAWERGAHPGAQGPVSAAVSPTPSSGTYCGADGLSL